jgi:hypothetical protein
MSRYIIRPKLLDSNVKEDIIILSTKWHTNGEGCGNCCDSGGDDDDDTHTTANTSTKTSSNTTNNKLTL